MKVTLRSVIVCRYFNTSRRVLMLTLLLPRKKEGQYVAVKEYSSEYSDSTFKVEDTIVSRR